jgi:hypothetical protein
MWKASIRSVLSDATPSVAQVTIEYADGERVKTVVERISDPNSIKQIALNGLKELNRADDIASLIANPTLGELDFSTPGPTQGEIEKQTYEQKRRELIQVKQDLDLGLINQTTYETKLSEVKALQK